MSEGRHAPGSVVAISWQSVFLGSRLHFQVPGLLAGGGCRGRKRCPDYRLCHPCASLPQAEPVTPACTPASRRRAAGTCLMSWGTAARAGQRAPASHQPARAAWSPARRALLLGRAQHTRAWLTGVRVCLCVCVACPVCGVCCNVGSMHAACVGGAGVSSYEGRKAMRENCSQSAGRVEALSTVTVVCWHHLAVYRRVLCPAVP